MIGAPSKAGVAAAVIAATVGASSPGAAQAQDPRPDEEAIRGAIAEMTDGFNRHDAAAATRMYAPDADVVGVRGERARGRAEAERRLATIFRTGAREATLRTEDVEVRFVRPDVAIVHAADELSGLVAPDGQRLPPHRETSTRVFVRNDGKWQVAAFHNTMARTMVRPFEGAATAGAGR